MTEEKFVFEPQIINAPFVLVEFVLGTLSHLLTDSLFYQGLININIIIHDQMSASYSTETFVLIHDDFYNDFLVEVQEMLTARQGSKERKTPKIVINQLQKKDLESLAPGLLITLTHTQRRPFTRELSRKFQNYNSQILKKTMFVHNLTERIQTSIDQLGKLLDILYKFPQQQRKFYLDKIQSLKTQMTTLKNNLKQTNALNIERQYNSLVVSLNSFRSKIEDQNHLIANKENRSTNISRVNREGKSNHEEALRLIAEKEEQIGELRLTLFQKEELIKINYQELRDYKRDCNALVEENKSMKIDILELESELSAVNQHLNRLEEQASFLRVQKEQLQRQMKADNEALNRFSNELMIAKDRLLHFEKLAQISMMKSSMVEQNIKKVQEEACRLNQSYKAREEEAIKKDRSIEELKRQLSKKDSNIQGLTQENKQYKDECAALENQLSNYQRSMFELRSAHKQLKDTYDQEMRQWSRKFDDLQMRQKQKSIEAEDNQTKFMNVYNKNTEILEQLEQLRSQDKKSKNFIEELKQKMVNYQSKNQALEYQNNELLEQKKKIISKLDECYSLISEKEQVVLQMSQKLQLRQIELAKTEELVHRYENMNRESESKKVSLQKSQLTLASEIASYKNKIFHLQERNIFCEKGMLDLKKRLVRAKLQAIHDVRNTISQ